MSDLILPAPYTGNDMIVIAKNDEHYDAMVNDDDFYTQMEKRNEQANQSTGNFNNAELTAAGNNAAQNAEVLVPHSESSAKWINDRYRPWMSVTYMAICIADFLVFPILWSLLQVWASGSVVTPWQPITLQSSGLIHLSFGAILGITVYGRSQEKVAELTNERPSRLLR